MEQRFHFSGVPTFWRSPVARIGDDLSEFDVAVLGVPIDAGVSFRAGAREAPRAIRQAAFVPPPLGRAYVNLDAPSERLCAVEHRLVDLGDVEVWPTDWARTLDNIQTCITQVRKSTFPLTLGGDHTLTYAAFAGCKAARPGRRIGLISFDSDSDAEDGFLTFDRLWHGDFIRRLIEDGLVVGSNVFLLGLHGIVDESVMQWCARVGVTIITRADIEARGVDSVMQAIRHRLLGQADDIYVSVDIDVVDGGVSPGTGWPSWGGLRPDELCRAMRSLREFPVIGFDLVEVSPPLDPSGLTVLLAVDVLWNFLRFGLAKQSSPDAS
jgi:guanidinopropionase